MSQDFIQNRIKNQFQKRKRKLPFLTLGFKIICYQFLQWGELYLNSEFSSFFKSIKKASIFIKNYKNKTNSSRILLNTENEDLLIAFVLFIEI